MRDLLGKFHPDFAYYERPGAGHWWGNECVGWPPLFDFLQRHVRPAEADVARVEFVTANPGIAASTRFVTMLAQEHALEYGKVAIDRGSDVVVVTWGALVQRTIDTRVADCPDLEEVILPGLSGRP